MLSLPGPEWRKKDRSAGHQDRPLMTWGRMLNSSESLIACHSRNPESFRESGILYLLHPLLAKEGKEGRSTGQAPIEAKLHTGQAGMTKKRQPIGFVGEHSLIRLKRREHD
jgi:hypothetical protein